MSVKNSILLILLQGIGFVYGFGIVNRMIATSSTTTSLALSTSDYISDKDAMLWTLRIVSAFATYFGFVAVTDRPRGRLLVPLVLQNDDHGDVFDGCLRVGQSNVPGAGLGLFAANSLPKGTVLGTYPGVVLPLQQHSSSLKVANYPNCLGYIWRFTDNQFVIDPTHEDGKLGEFCYGGNPSQPFSVIFFNNPLGKLWEVPTALCRINEPPKGKDVNVVTAEDLESRTVTFALERDVYEGEELYIDYGLHYDRTGYF